MRTFNLPAVGDTMVEGEIVEWFVQVGDVVSLDQPICSVETDKSVVEMTTPFRGIVLELGGEVGDLIAVGSPLITVGAANETVAAPIGGPPAESPSAGWTPSPLVRKLAADHTVDLHSLAGSGVGGRITRTDVEAAIAAKAGSPTNGNVLAMPKVRRYARERSIDLAAAVGTGPRGSITIADLDLDSDLDTGSFPERGARPAPDRREPLSAMRRSIGAHLTQSVQTIPQFTSMVDVDASGLLATRNALSARLDESVPIDAVLMALMIPVLRDHPIVNAALDGDEIVYYSRFNLGVAVDTPDGLMVPVVTDADQHDLAGLAAEIRRLATAARARTIAPHELAGATCTLNNVGALGVVQGTPILPLATSAIVAFGVARPLVQLRNGNPVEVPTMTVSATFDHRLIDGGDSGRFLAQLKQHLEVPALGLL